MVLVFRGFFLFCFFPPHGSISTGKNPLSGAVNGINIFNINIERQYAAKTFLHIFLVKIIFIFSIVATGYKSLYNLYLQTV